MKLITLQEILVTASNAFTGVNVQCEWVADFRASGAEEAADNFLGNLIGVIMTYWPYILLVVVAIALVTMVIFRRNNSMWVKIAALAAVVAVVFLPILDFAPRIGGGVC